MTREVLIQVAPTTKFPLFCEVCRKSGAKPRLVGDSLVAVPIRPVDAEHVSLALTEAGFSIVASPAP